MISLNRYYTLYYREARHLIENLMKWNTIERIQKLHSLKGTAKALQLNSQVDKLFQMEDSAKEQESNSLQAQLESFQKELEQWKGTFHFDETSSLELEGLGARLEPILREKNIQLHVEGHCPIPQKYETSLLLWLTQLAQNSATHAFTAKSHQATLRLCGEMTKDELIIKIEDNGKGINLKSLSQKAPAPLKGKLEKMVGKANLTNADRQIILEAICLHHLSTLSRPNVEGGRGVGLASIRQDIEKLKGQLKILSTSPLGTVLEIRLPVP